MNSFLRYAFTRDSTEMCNFRIFKPQTQLFFSPTVARFDTSSDDVYVSCLCANVCVCGCVLVYTMLVYVVQDAIVSTTNIDDQVSEKDTSGSSIVVFFSVCFTLTCKYQLSCQMRNDPSWAIILGILFCSVANNNNKIFVLCFVLSIKFGSGVCTNFSIKWINAIDWTKSRPNCVCVICPQSRRDKKINYYSN